MGKANNTGQPPEKTDEDQPKQLTKPNMVEAGRIWRDLRSGDFFPQLDGKVFRSSSEMTEEQKARFTRLLEVLQSWIKLPQNGSEAGQPALKVSAGDVAGDDLQPVLDDKHISYNPIKAFSDAIGVENNRPKSVSMSIVAQVDEILQEKLENTPLAKRGISMKDSFDGGLLVWVGLQQYASIDEVPDPEVRQVLRESVEEWERRLDQ